MVKVGDKVEVIGLDWEDEMNGIELGHSGIVEKIMLEDDGLSLTDGNFFYFNQLEKVGEVNEHISEAIEILERPKPSELTRYVETNLGDLAELLQSAANTSHELNDKLKKIEKFNLKTDVKMGDKNNG